MPNEQVPPQPQYGEYAGQQQVPPPQYYVPAPPPVLRAPEGTKPYTVWIWLIVALPVVALAWTIPEMFRIASFYTTFMTSMFSQLPMDGSTLDPAQQQAIIGPMLRQEFQLIGVLIVPTLLGWLSYGVTVVLAWLDWRALGRRSVPRPFHWAWAFLSGFVYVIGRIVVVWRRAGNGLAVLWVFIATNVALLALGIVFTVILFEQVFAAIRTSLPA